MIRTIFWFICFFGDLIMLFPKLKKVEKIEDLNARRLKAHQESAEWAMKRVKQAGCIPSVIGLEKIPQDTACLFVANHQSNFDVALAMSQIDIPKGFIAKVETKKIPMIGNWMKYIECIFIDRSDIRQQVKAISEGSKSLISGQSMVIFPEGTRSVDGSLGEFKPGAMKLATKSKCPVIPVTINGSMNIMKKGKMLIKPGKVDIIISDPIYVEGIYEKDTKLLTEKVKSEIQKNLVI